MKNIQNYVRAQSLEEAYTLNQKKRNRIIAGMLWTRMESGNIQTAIDLCDLGLDKIEENENEFVIGAMVTLRQLQLHEGFEAYCDGIVAKAVKDIVGVQFRNLATVGGSIWGRFGFSDVLTAFMALDTYVELYQGGVIPLEEFARMPYDRDLLVRIIVKKTPVVCTYQAMRAQKTDFPILTCAVSYMNGSYKTVIGARPAKAVSVCDEKHLLGEQPDEQQIEAYASYVAEQVETGSNMRGSAEYRTHLVKVLTARSVLELGGRR